MSAWLNTVIVDLEKGLQRPNKVTDCLIKYFPLEDKTEQKKLVVLNSYFFTGLFGLLIFGASIDVGSKLLFGFFGIVYPVYRFMHVIWIALTRNNNLQLPVNWFIFTAFGLTEFLYDIPSEAFELYLSFKTLFLIWYCVWFSYRVLCGREYATLISSEPAISAADKGSQENICHTRLHKKISSG